MFGGGEGAASAALVDARALEAEGLKVAEVSVAGVAVEAADAVEDMDPVAVELAVLDMVPIGNAISCTIGAVRKGYIAIVPEDSCRGSTTLTMDAFADPAQGPRRDTAHRRYRMMCEKHANGSWS